MNIIDISKTVNEDMTVYKNKDSTGITRVGLIWIYIAEAIQMHRCI